MTTTVCTTTGAPDAGALFVSGDADPYAEIRHLLPKLAKPSWVRLMGKTLAKPKCVEASTAAKKAMRRNERKLSRFARALNGERTRVARPKAA